MGLTPLTRSFGDVSIFALERKHAPRLQELLVRNRAWLAPWEATLPGGGRPVINARLIIRHLREQQRRSSLLAFGIGYRGELVGQVTVASIQWGALMDAQLGYWISQHVESRGITTRAVALALDEALLDFGLHRVEICVRPENARSLRIPEKLGLEREGLRRNYINIAGSWADHEVFVASRENAPRGYVARLGAAQGDEDARRFTSE